MKLTKLFSVMMVAIAASLLTSCLESGNNEFTTDPIPGVAYRDKGKTLVNSIFMPIYATDFDSRMPLNEGDCVMVGYAYNSDAPENANEAENGYSHVTLTAVSSVNKGSVGMKTDTTTLLDKEIALKAGIATLDYHYFAYLNEHMFITSGFTGLDKQINNWQMFIDVDQEPEKKDDNNIYTVFIRATLRSEGQTPSGDYLQTNAYNIGYHMEQIENKEKADGKTKFHLRFGYINEIKDDGTYTWKFTDPIGPFEIADEQ